MTYNLFRFFDELELTKLRLQVLSGVVDQFVAIESSYTTVGDAKPLVLSEHANEFKGFNLKICANTNIHRGSLLESEAHQWTAIYPFISSLREDDTILITDADEIPDPSVFKQYAKTDGIVGLHMNHYHYWLNWVGNEQMQQGFRNYTMKLCRGIDLFHRTPWGVRWYDAKTYNRVLNTKGWHFSYMGGIDRISEKLKATSKGEWNKDCAAQCMDEGKDFYHPERGIVFLEENRANLPQYVQDNWEYYKERKFVR